jgi:hypothetical protein
LTVDLAGLPDRFSQLFHVKRAFITLVKEENVLEMFDPQEPHSLIMQQDEGICHQTLKSPDGVFSVPDMAMDERYVDAVRCPLPRSACVLSVIAERIFLPRFKAFSN